ncbi:uncharacterized protein RHOBADRAFT_53308, partial [Rhodotorula graminis WP1]
DPLALVPARRRRRPPRVVPRRTRRLPVRARPARSTPQARASAFAHLDLARAKLALGPSRVSPRSYDLSDHAAQLGVALEPTTTASTTAEEEGNDEAHPPQGAVRWTVETRARAPAAAPGSDTDPAAAAATSSTLRRRAP